MTWQTRRRKPSPRRSANDNKIVDPFFRVRCSSLRGRASTQSEDASRELPERRCDLRLGDGARRQTIAHDYYQTTQCERKTTGHFRCWLVELRFSRSTG